MAGFAIGLPGGVAHRALAVDPGVALADVEPLAGGAEAEGVGFVVEEDGGLYPVAEDFTASHCGHAGHLSHAASSLPILAPQRVQMPHRESHVDH